MNRQNYCSNLNSGMSEIQCPPHLGQTRPPLEPTFGDPDRLKEIPIFGGNYTRNKYDRGSHEIDTRQSTMALEYTLDPTYAEQCQPCRSVGPGWLSKQGISYDTRIPLVDTESELKNLNRVLTRDPNYKYVPYCPNCLSCADGNPCSSGVGNGCEQCQPKMFHFRACGNRDEYTRISNPACTIKETGVNRFQPLCLNPQDESRWLHPGNIGISYRLVAKDNSVPCIPIPLDQNPALPKGGDLPCELTAPTCSNNIAPMHVFQV